MSKRSAKFVLALFATILAGANFTAVAQNGTASSDSTKPADNCLTSPKGAALAGSHWYYRIERGTKRKCWYVREENGKAAKTAAAPQDSSELPDSSSPAETANPPQQGAVMSESVANARAELTSPQPNAQATSSVFDSARRASAPDAGTQSSLVSTRWLDSSSMTSSDTTKVAAADTAASPQAEPQPAPEPAASTVTHTAAESTAEKQSASTQMLLLVMAGALALAGLIGGVIYRLNRTRTPPYDVDNEWRAPWDPEHTERGAPPVFTRRDQSLARPAELPQPRRVEAAQEEPTFEETQREIKEMLARLAKSATA